MSFLHHLSIKQKLLSLVVIMSLCTVLVGYTGYNYVHQANSRIDDLYQQRLVPIRDLNALRVHYTSIQADIALLMVQTDQAKYDIIMKDIEKRDGLLKKLFENAKAYISDEAYAKLKDSNDKFNQQRAKIIFALTNGKKQDGIALYDEFGQYLNQLNSDLSALADAKAVQAEATKQDNQTGAKQAYVYLIAIIAIGVVFSLSLGYFAARLIIVPLRKAGAVALRVAQGDLQVDPLPARGRGEVAKLGGAINDMVASLRMLLGEIRSSSERVAVSAEELRTGSGYAREAGAQTAQAMEDIQEGIRTQLTSIHETTRAMEEMASGIQHIAGGNDDVAAASEIASSRAENGMTVITHSVATIEELADGVKDAAEGISRLGDRTREIDKVIELITTIARQTNMLALNAGIEAARAGAQGRGFGVVAEEVKKLAEQTSQAAVQVSGLIEEIQTETKRLVEQMTVNATKAGLGAQAAHEAGEAFGGIREQVVAVMNRIVAVSATVQQMSAGSEQVLASSQALLGIAETSSEQTERVSAATGRSLKAIDRIGASSDTLNEVAVGLQEIVKGFRV